MAIKRSKTFEEKAELIKLQDTADKEKYKRSMLQLEYRRENNRLEHERELERGRIKSAEIRKMQDRKELSNMGKYPKKY